MNRRSLLTGLGLAALLAGCTSPSADAQFAQAKAYLDAGTAALLAAAQQYLIGPPPPTTANAQAVRTGMAALEQARTTLDAITLPQDWKSGALEAVSVMQALAANPVLTPFLGPAAPYIPLVIAVVTAYINALPAPINAPPAPPPALQAKARQYRRNAS